jgi:hypothetical protein
LWRLRTTWPNLPLTVQLAFVERPRNVIGDVACIGRTGSASAGSPRQHVQKAGVGCSPRAKFSFENFYSESRIFCRTCKPDEVKSMRTPASSLAIHRRHKAGDAILYAFDLLEPDGADLCPMLARTRDNAGRRPKIEKLVIGLEIRGDFRILNFGACPAVARTIGPPQKAAAAAAGRHLCCGPARDSRIAKK